MHFQTEKFFSLDIILTIDLALFWGENSVYPNSIVSTIRGTKKRKTHT